MKPAPKEVSPRKVLAEIAAAIPAEVHPGSRLLAVSR